MLCGHVSVYSHQSLVSTKLDWSAFWIRDLGTSYESSCTSVPGKERSKVIKMATAGTRSIKPAAEANVAFGNRQSHQLPMKPICMCVLVCGNWESTRFREVTE